MCSLRCLTLFPLHQAISNSKSEKHQDVAWKAVCPSVLLLRKFYDFTLELETALCQLLTVLCSPEMTALQHLENQQVECVCVGGGGCGCVETSMELGPEDVPLSEKLLQELCVIFFS